ncbi:hypothetical protein PEPS_13290 [Persicobacter psychrovividus]|uniref:5-hmdU DNA kinase helical domain-containing protein n=2 Tax=Persicobacter psychrovividus TaxID=387638 RepID=A0ABN6L884_9BACT|nr:hypothetical protein PEPS_13290 [Persicobacter psychrovividus]
MDRVSKVFYQWMEQELLFRPEQLHLTEALLRKWKVYDQLEAIYLELGGQSKRIFIPKNITVWTANRRAVLIDSPLDYNRYRLQTFRADWYAEKMPEMDVKALGRFCRNKEKECLKMGIGPNLWTSKVAEDYFGKPEAPGDFFENGAPAWRLRAWNSLMTDVACHGFFYNLQRVSIYKTIMHQGKLRPLQELLLAGKPEDAEKVGKIVLAGWK